MIFEHIKHDYSLPELDCETLKTGRTYKTPEGNKYPSITTVLGATSDKSGLDDWVKRVGKKEADRVLHHAGIRGTNVHQMTEDYLNNKEDWDKNQNLFDKYTFNTVKPILDKRVNNIWAQEVPLYSDKLKLAGRVDCIADFDGVLSIIDFKTSRKEKKREWITGYFVQAAFYAAAFYERTGISIKQSAIIMAVDDGNPLVFVQDTHSYLKELLARRKQYAEMKGI